MTTDDLNRCLRSELSAIETYRQALEKHRQEYGHEPQFHQLSRMLQEHEDAGARLRGLVQQHGGTPSTDSGAWGALSKTVMGAAKLLGDKAALKALKEGEESGLKEYQGVSQDTSTPADVKSAVSALLARQQEHIGQLDRLIDTA